MNTQTRLRQIGPDVEVPTEQPAPPARSGLDAAALSMILLGLKSLSQRALVALSTLFTIASVLSVWWLFYSALPANPSINQLVGLGMYGAFVLLVHRVKR